MESENPPLFALLAVLSTLMSGFAGKFAWVALAISIGFSLAAMAGATKHWSSSPATLGASIAASAAALLASCLIAYWQYLVHWTF